MKSALSLVEIKELLRSPIKKESFACSLVEQGVPRGAITEVSGPGKTSFAAQLIGEHPSLRVAWIEESFSVYPLGLQQKKVTPRQVVFIEAQNDMEWAALQVLRSQSFPMVILYTEELDLKSLRRIQLASEKANAATLWLTSEEQAFWTTSVQLAVSRKSKKLDVQVRRSR